MKYLAKKVTSIMPLMLVAHLALGNSNAFELNLESDRTHHIVNYYVQGVSEYQDSPVTVIGGAGTGNNINVRTQVLGFALPELASTTVIEDLVVSFQLDGIDNAPDWDVQLYMYNQNSVPAALDADDAFWADSGEDTRGFTQTVSLEAATPTSPTGELIEVIVPGTFLDDFYDQSGSLIGDGIVWFRINPGRAGDGMGTQRYRINLNSVTLTLNLEAGSFISFMGLVVDDYGYVDTGDWIGKVYARYAPYVYHDILGWMWIDEARGTLEDGAWGYFFDRR